MFDDHRLFFREFWRNFHTTGAVAPSGRWLARALTRYVRHGHERAGRKILEVGPGTGAVTQYIVKSLRPDDRLDLVELNDKFVERLEHRLAHDPVFKPVAERTRVLHQCAEKLPIDARYDVIVSGLPLNNFAVDTVECLLQTMISRLAEGGTLSFFEYVGVRRLKSLGVSGAERERLQGISRCMQRVLGECEFRRDYVLPNLPPACVHHLRAGLRAEAPVAAAAAI